MTDFRPFFSQLVFLAGILYLWNMVALNCHGKTKNLNSKTKYLLAKPNTSQQKQNSFGFAVGICFCREVFNGFCCEVFDFAVRSLVLLWGILFLLWGFHEVFVFGVRFSVLPWGILFVPWGFWFCRDSCGPLYWNQTCHCLFYIHYFHTDVYPTKFCIMIVSNFSWVLQSSREKSKTMVMQNFGG